ncbi:radixin-like [Cimex lectularius]|uniref:Moesin/ezrin/radixin homolog 1 n=1 Tax=Cimex lectularius TaxID=79782 RepID=A0A8I6RS75_CIMLE|nr:radixin-like [Cimex lectularius]
MNVLTRKERTYTFLINYLGGVLTLEQSIKVTGKELFTFVCTCLGVVEYWYFGLQYETSKKRSMWVRPNTKIYSLVRKSGTPLFFLVKYFPEEIGRVNEEITLSLIYKQSKGSIVSGAIFCTPETSILLGSYTLQAEYGDWPCVDYKNLNLSSILPAAVLEQYTMTHKNWSESLRAWHKDHQGLTKKEAQLEYMRVAQYLGMYGVNYFPTKWQGNSAWLGIHPKGINIYMDNMLVPKTCLKWIFIRMVHYSCHKFIIKTVLTHTPEFVFSMKTLRMTRQVFEFSVGYHHLYLRTRSLTSIEVHKVPEDDVLDTEKFKEVSEEICQNETASAPNSMFRRFSQRFQKKTELPVLNEEEEHLI